MVDVEPDDPADDARPAPGWVARLLFAPSGYLSTVTGLAPDGTRDAFLGGANLTEKAWLPFMQFDEKTTSGVATGLAWTPFGGDILFIEATGNPGAGGFILTGQLGEVMRESAQAALSVVIADDERRVDADQSEFVQVVLAVIARLQAITQRQQRGAFSESAVPAVRQRPVLQRRWERRAVPPIRH